MTISRQSLWIIILVLGAGVLLNAFDIEIGTNQAAEGPASLLLSYDNGEARKFQGPVAEGMTILEALNSASLAGGFDIRYWVDANGDVNLAAINGQVANDIKGWRLYLNGSEIGTKDIGRIRIKKYDFIEARFE